MAKLREYSDRDCVQFVEDMENAGFEVEHYRGRFFWEGPAVRVGDTTDATRVTQVRTQFDQMGLGYIVYPVASDGGK